MEVDVRKGWSYDMNMTTEQKQIAIAEFDGQTCDNCGEILCGCAMVEIGSGTPDYLTSRDAICGAVAKLPDWDENGKDKAEYSERLAYVVGANWSSNNVEDRRRIFEATASQMADALLLTLGHQI